MARRKSNTSATGANMDSLLDALTNVVGILAQPSLSATLAW